MRLTDLEPEWVNRTGAGRHQRFCDSHAHVDIHYSEGEEPGGAEDIAAADGVLFLCPVCFARQGRVGTESVLCWFNGRGVPPEELPGPGRWNASGASFDDLTLVPSVNVDHGHWHGFITNGEVTNA